MEDLALVLFLMIILSKLLLKENDRRPSKHRGHYHNK